MPWQIPLFDTFRYSHIYLYVLLPGNQLEFKTCLAHSTMAPPDNPNQALQLVRQRRTPNRPTYAAHMIFDPLFGSHTLAPITRPLLCTPLDLIFHCPCTAHCGLRLHLVAIVLWLSGDHSKISIKVFHSTMVRMFCHLNSV